MLFLYLLTLVAATFTLLSKDATRTMFFILTTALVAMIMWIWLAPVWS